MFMNGRAWTVYIMFKKKDLFKDWEITDNVYFCEEDGKAAAERFTEDSVGWKYKIKPFKEAN